MPANIKNASAINFPIATSAGVDVTHVGLWSNEATPKFLAGKAVSGDPAAIAQDQRFSIDAEMLIVAVPDGEGTADAAKRAADGWITGGLRVSLHTGDPGTTGANEVTASWYARQTVAAASWTVTKT